MLHNVYLTLHTSHASRQLLLVLHNILKSIDCYGFFMKCSAPAKQCGAPKIILIGMILKRDLEKIALKLNYIHSTRA